MIRFVFSRSKFRKVWLERGLSGRVLKVQTQEPEFRPSAPTDKAMHGHAQLLSPEVGAEAWQNPGDIAGPC